jgi:cell division protein FtsI/penicillin-binding protein 2
VDRYGRSILGADSSGALPPEPGRHIVLTIDWSLQEVVELAVDRMMEVNQPRAATCVVMDPNDGSILALASRPAFNPAGLQPGLKEEEIRRRLKNLPVIR